MRADRPAYSEGVGASPLARPARGARRREGNERNLVYGRASNFSSSGAGRRAQRRREKRRAPASKRSFWRTMRWSARGASARPVCVRDSARRSTCRAQSCTAIRRALRSSMPVAANTKSPSGRVTRARAKNSTERMASLAAREGAQIRTRALFRAIAPRDGQRHRRVCRPCSGVTPLRSRHATSSSRPVRRRGSTTAFGTLAWPRWRDGLMTTLQYRVYLDGRRRAIAYRTLELHYYRRARRTADRCLDVSQTRSSGDRSWRVGKDSRRELLRAELDAFAERVRARLYPGVGVTSVKTEGHLLYGGAPRPTVAQEVC